MRVLIVEDDPTVGEVMRDLCLELGHAAETVLSAEDALVRLAGGDRPDLILLDFRLPRMSGLDFLRLPLVRDTAIPIIVMSGIAADHEAQECLALGAVQFLAKPVPLEQLQRLLKWFEEPARRPVERRRVPRASVALPVQVRERDGTEWETTSVNLSPLAMKVRSAGATRPGATVELSFAAPGRDQRIKATSLLVRADLDGYVFYFLNLTTEHVERLTDLVHRLTVYPRPP
jgi:CheY-like chemotaxis protein